MPTPDTIGLRCPLCQRTHTAMLSTLEQELCPEAGECGPELTIWKLTKLRKPHTHGRLETPHQALVFLQVTIGICAVMVLGPMLSPMVSDWLWTLPLYELGAFALVLVALSKDMRTRYRRRAEEQHWANAAYCHDCAVDWDRRYR